MSEYLTLSRAARLVGVTRGALQQQIRNGELTTFEGKILVTELLRLYPQTKMEDTTMLDRVEKIKAEATHTRGREHETIILPTPEILTTRLTVLSQELSKTKTHLDRYVKLVDTLMQELVDIQGDMIHLPTKVRALHEWLVNELQNRPLHITPEGELFAKDAFLRVITAHVKLLPSEHDFWVEGNDSLLEAALRAGIILNYGCSSGQCGKCKARIVSGEVHKIRHHDYIMNHTEKDMGYRLLCSYTAVTDLVIEAGEAHQVEEVSLQQIEAKIHKLEYITNDLLILEVKTPRAQTLRFFAGQKATLTLTHGPSADYFMASCPCDGRYLQFHIHKSPNDFFSEKLFNTLQIGQNICLEGPKGHFVLNGALLPTLFIAYNHGFAPIKSLIEHALALDRIPSFHLYWLSEEEPYLDNRCRSWMDALDNFYYTPLKTDKEHLEYALKRMLEDHPDLSGFEVYLAGVESFVHLAKAIFSKYHLPESQLHVGIL